VYIYTYTSISIEVIVQRSSGACPDFVPHIWLLSLEILAAIVHDTALEGFYGWLKYCFHLLVTSQINENTIC
jgi:hypothetical protein